jgi:hypothetical protein
MEIEAGWLWLLGSSSLLYRLPSTSRILLLYL